MELKYMALVHTTREVIWLRALLIELGLPPDGATTILRMASNEVKVQHCASEENLADIFTKGLPLHEYLSAGILGTRN
ncbi:uncharacterized protein EV420DRAFT_1572149 [Desarmillaria tabescens]|uniref:Uncharacterized protein n=1 Tax=Armillaria tabescens TaxID=1929756 RepID=A0AA39JPY6_ARMTA|nr:uncharacterized protein EV420DRAFT_1572149 [Desarmillaria tabescens]KAK0445676.1 hypothetical protein EV420DRAFT_1572149 [Desarmillaria tabescens]